MYKSNNYKTILHTSKCITSSSRVKNVSKSLSQIPTLPCAPLIGHSYLFLPGGKYSSERLTEAIHDISKSLGPIFKLRLGGSDMVITIDADHAETLFRNEGKLPIRPPFPALLHYRKKNFNSIGIVPGNGEEWYKFRKGILPLLKPGIIKTYARKHEEIAEEFVEYIKRNRNKEFVVNDIYTHLLKFSIEAISVVSPGYQFRCIDENQKNASKISEASNDFMDGLYSTLINPMWKLYKNSGYKKLEYSHTIIHSIIKEHLRTHKEKYQNKDMERNSFIYTLLDNKLLRWEDVVMLAIEIFLAGIDTTATTVALTLHYLSHNIAIQNLARDECLGESNKNSFLRACIKETLRISPTAGGNSRVLIRDTTFGDYNIPAGTLVLACGSVSSQRDKYFSKSSQYNPHRWLRSSGTVLHPFASLPFGYGPRMCPGKYLAEQEMLILLKQILQTFKLEPLDSPEIGMVYRMNRIPDRKINVKFINTNC